MRPIFVLGVQRSGTTLLANRLAASGDVAAVAAEDHNGVHESIFFSHFARAFGPFEDAAGRAAFARHFAASDYCLLAGIGRSELDGFIARAGSYPEVFRHVMDTVAQREGARAWVEKSPHHTLLFDDIAAAFPDARFVAVIRGTEGMLRSRLQGFGRQVRSGVRRLADILRGAVANTLHARFLTRIAAREQVLLVRYEDLTGPEGARISEVIARHVGIEHLPPSGYAANTSHAGTAPYAFTTADRAMIALGTSAARIVPVDLLVAISRWRGRRRGPDWPDWCWKRHNQGANQPLPEVRTHA